MEHLLRYLKTVTDMRQERKVLHKMSDIIALVFFATLANANEWVEIEAFGREHEGFLREYLDLPNGIPSHDTIQRVFAMLAPEFLQRFQRLWNEMLNSREGEKVRRILGINGAGERTKRILAIDGKSNEITAIPDLLDALNIRGHIITTDAMGTQTQVVKRIRKRQADYVLALKENQPNLYADVKLYFADPHLLAGCAYTKTVQKAHSGIEQREYWQSEDIGWLSQKKDWVGLKSIAMTRNTTTRDGNTTTQTRYYISSLPLDVSEIARAIRGHWMIESDHWHLGVTFREDANHTLEKQSAFNLNILRKLAMHVLKRYDTGNPRMSMKLKRFSIGTNPHRHLAAILAM